MLIIAKCRSKVLQNAPREHSAILLTFIKLPFVFKTFVLSIFKWPLKTGFTVETPVIFFSSLFRNDPLFSIRVYWLWIPQILWFLNICFMIVDSIDPDQIVPSGLG